MRIFLFVYCFVFLPQIFFSQKTNFETAYLHIKKDILINKEISKQLLNKKFRRNKTTINYIIFDTLLCLDVRLSNTSLKGRKINLAIDSSFFKKIYSADLKLLNEKYFNQNAQLVIFFSKVNSDVVIGEIFFVRQKPINYSNSFTKSVKIFFEFDKTILKNTFIETIIYD